jgi:chemotaxis-related protein WspB
MLLLTFTAGSSRYALAATRVVEVLPKLELRPIPHASELLSGLLSYRGKVVPVIDLGLLVGSAPSRNLLSSRMILVDDSPSQDDPNRVPSAAAIGSFTPVPGQAPTLLGLVAEDVNDLTYVQPEQIGPIPVPVPNAPYIHAVVKTDRGIVPVIAVERVRDHLICGAFSGQSAVLSALTNQSESVHGDHEVQACPT